MTESQAIELIWERFTDPSLGWSAFSAVPVVLQNEAFPDVDSFAQLSVRHLTSNQITQGSPARFERRGMIFVKLWVSVDTGQGGLAGLADAARSVFEKQQLPRTGDDPVTILAGLTQELPPDGRHAMSVVSFPFRYYAQR